ncbi:MAG: type III-A CRISPR-associated RAMP protein Csm3 [Chloroflexi bacterium]|nr:type III-A CRISPR-associated RAMP protein Csm3 [Chloroflexota bacterium]
MTDIRLYGRIFISGEVLAVTGLHIGAENAGIQIGGIDNAILRNPLNDEPYIPGSSIRGKMRSLMEKYLKRPQNQRIGRDVFIHSCEVKPDFDTCDVCHVFGVPGEREFSEPARLIVRDVALSKGSRDALLAARTDLPYAELKTEVAIDRVTSAATPRTQERVPAGAVFGPATFIFNVYDLEHDLERLLRVSQALALLEDDYLGGQGSRGSGQIRFQGLTLWTKGGEDYRDLAIKHEFRSVAELHAGLPALTPVLRQALER